MRKILLWLSHIVLCFNCITCSDVNIILIVADDLGYEDLGSFGSPTIETPNIDLLYSNGVKFTQFYNGAPLCTPSRSAMLTGRLPVRSGIYTDFDYPLDSLFRVFYPTSVGCLPDTEITIADAMKPKYSTLMIGKWHLGHNQEKNCLPGNGNKGFDFFYGIPYSHEEGYPGPLPEGVVFPPVPLMASGYYYVEQPFNESDLTSRYTSLTQDLIRNFAKGQNKQLKNTKIRKDDIHDHGQNTERETYDRLINEIKADSNTNQLTGEVNDLDFSKPFFLHLAYENPHVPLFVSADYPAGSSRRGLYGDSVQEMDQSIGMIIQTLQEYEGMFENTLIVFTTDNGAWTSPSNGLNDNRVTMGVGPFDGGSNGPYTAGGKGSTYEGGFRAPFLLSYPAMIPGSQIIRTPITGMDLFPTFLDFAGISLPDSVIDGLSLKDLLISGTANDDKTDLHDCIYFWREHTLYAIRCGQYKGHFITRSGFDFSDPGTTHDPPLLFNVEWDAAEAIPLDTTTRPYAQIAKLLKAAGQAHIDSVVKAPSEYLHQNWTLAPCCPRGALDTNQVSFFNNNDITDSLFNNDIELPNVVTTELIKEILSNNYAEINDYVAHSQQQYWQSRHYNKLEGPWRDCICTRIKE